MKKQKEICVCDYCGKELTEPFIRTEDVTNEGASTISYRHNVFDVGGQEYCSLSCLTADIAKALKWK